VEVLTEHSESFSVPRAHPGCGQDITHRAGGILHAKTLQLVLLAQGEQMGCRAALDKHTPQSNPKCTAEAAMNAIKS
jgi:hypothetical protein